MTFVRVENFLSKFKKLGGSDGRENKIQEILKEGVRGKEFKVAVRGKTIYCYDLSPVAKSEMFIKKKDLIEKITKALKGSAPNEISFRKP